MKRTATTIDLADFVEQRFLSDEDGAILADDLVEIWRRERSTTTAAAREHVEAHASTAMDLLRERGWYIAPVTEAFFFDYERTIPSRDDEIRRCVAGMGHAQYTAGWYCAKHDNTELHIMAYLRDLRSGNGKVEKAARNMADALAEGDADPAAVAAANDAGHMRSTKAQMTRVLAAAKPPAEIARTR